MTRLKRVALLLVAGIMAAIHAIRLAVSKGGSDDRTEMPGPDQSAAAKAHVAGMLSVDLSGR